MPHRPSTERATAQAIAHMASSSSAPKANRVTTVKRTAAALGPADPAPPVKRRRLAFASPPPSSVKAATSQLGKSPSPSAGKATAPRARAVWATRTPTRATSSMKAAAWARLASSRSPTRFLAGKCSSRLVRGIRTAGASSSVKAATSRASRSAGKAATPAVRGTPRTAASRHLVLLRRLYYQEAKSRRLRDDRISSLSKIKKEATEGRDAAATIAASVLQEASIFDSVIRNTSKFSDICDSAKVSDPLPTVDAFLGVYEDTIQWKDVAECVASVELSSAKYRVGGGPDVVHELSLPNNAPKTKSTAKERTAELAKDLCGQMQRWFLAFVEEALDVENKWKHRSDTSTLLSQFEKISHWLEQAKHQIVEQEWTKEMIKRLEGRIGHNLRRLKEWGHVAPRTQSRRPHQ